MKKKKKKKITPHFFCSITLKKNNSNFLIIFLKSIQKKKKKTKNKQTNKQIRSSDTHKSKMLGMEMEMAPRFGAIMYYRPIPRLRKKTSYQFCNSHQYGASKND